MPISSHDPNPGALPGESSSDELASMQDQKTSVEDMKSAGDSLPTNSGNEEPELVLEPDLPSDGRDEKGEAMIRDLPQRPELSEPPSQPSPSSIKP